MIMKNDKYNDNDDNDNNNIIFIFIFIIIIVVIIMKRISKLIMQNISEN